MESKTFESPKFEIFMTSTKIFHQICSLNPSNNNSFKS
jgi:hypothetical protein